RVQGGVQKYVEQLGAARPRHGMYLPVQLDHRGGRWLVAGVLDLYRGERVGVQRPEDLDMYLLRRHIQRFEGFGCGRPCRRSRPWPTVSRSGYLAASSRRASPKITERLSRLA